ncbi:uncharacterized protein [Hetaerina americana]|uniref:uncharacterized protein n=1 Tax=Hetaerina americana TaxID=62018 RepID=UPI003A7F4F41
MVRHLVDTINIAMESSIPRKKVHPHFLWILLPTPVRALIRRRNNIRRLWQRYRTIDLKRQLKALNEEVHIALAEVRKDHWESHLEEELLNEDGEESMNGVWKLCRKLRGSQHTDPLIISGNHVAASPAEKVEMLARYLEGVFTPNPGNSASARIETEIHDAEEVNDEIPTPVIEKEDIIAVIRLLHPRKAPGSDGISNNVIRELPKAAVAYLANIFNGCDRTFVTSWLRTDSGVRRIHAGVLQGSVLGPMLFNIYTHDIPRDHGRHGILSLYADDAALLYRSWQVNLAAERLQEAIDDLIKWYRRWRIEVNAGKTKAIVFQTSRRAPPDERMSVGGVVLPSESSILVC